jgi:tetratricopeptide (TPR) repeat protein
MRKNRIGALLLTLLLTAGIAAAQPGITTPPSGGNQKSSVTQWMGLVKITIDYSSPDITSPSGADRRGKIWGEGALIPYGMATLNFGNCGANCPWRAGSNENTTFTVSHDVKIEGQPLKAGTYGVHMIPGEKEWTIIFSNNSVSWGSFFYKEEEDALRVQVKSSESAYNHYLTYEFTDRQLDKTTVALRWEDLQVPFTISVDDMTTLYVDNLRNELRSSPGFNWRGWQGAAAYCLQNNTNLEEAMQWAEAAATTPFIGAENFTTLQTLAQAQMATGKNEEAEATLTKAIEHPTATVFGIHGLGRQLITGGMKEKALEIFEYNVEKFGNVWPTQFGLARGYSALGDYKNALKYAKNALKNAPAPPNKARLEGLIATLEKGEDIN